MLALSASAWTTKRNLTGIGTFLVVVLLAVIVGGLANLFLLRSGLLAVLMSVLQLFGLAGGREE